MKAVLIWGYVGLLIAAAIWVYFLGLEPSLRDAIITALVALFWLTCAVSLQTAPAEAPKPPFAMLTVWLAAALFAAAAVAGFVPWAGGPSLDEDVAKSLRQAAQLACLVWMFTSDRSHSVKPALAVRISFGVAGLLVAAAFALRIADGLGAATGLEPYAEVGMIAAIVVVITTWALHRYLVEQRIMRKEPRAKPLVLS